MKHEHIVIADDREDGAVCLIQGTGSFRDYILIDKDDLEDFYWRLDKIVAKRATKQLQSIQSTTHPTYQKP